MTIIIQTFGVHLSATMHILVAMTVLYSTYYIQSDIS